MTYLMKSKRAAILGGTALYEQLEEPTVNCGQDEREALVRVLDSKKWWRGVSLEEMAESECGYFENEFCAYQGLPHGLCVTNGTAAIEAACKALDLKPGDEVIVPALSFIVTATAITNVGGRVKFVDVLPDTFQINPEAIAAAITPRTCGICLVHYGGYPADMEKIMPLAEKHGLWVLEDCAHAHGSELNGKGLGSWGDAGTFSFQMSKTLTAGEGGFIGTKHAHIRDKAYSLHHLGRREGEGIYEFEMLAWNLRMTEWQGAILRCQLRLLDDAIRRKEENARWFIGELEKNTKFIKGLKKDDRITRRGFYQLNLRYDSSANSGLSRDAFCDAVAAEGVTLGRGYLKPIYDNPIYAEYLQEIDCPVAETICKDSQITVKNQYFSDRSLLEKMLEAIYKIQNSASEIVRYHKTA